MCNHLTGLISRQLSNEQQTVQMYNNKDHSSPIQKLSNPLPDIRQSHLTAYQQTAVWTVTLNVAYL